MIWLVWKKEKKNGVCLLILTGGVWCSAGVQEKNKALKMIHKLIKKGNYKPTEVHHAQQSLAKYL